jgi:hypothetical protein
MPFVFVFVALLLQLCLSALSSSAVGAWWSLVPLVPRFRLGFKWRRLWCWCWWWCRWSCSWKSRNACWRGEVGGGGGDADDGLICPDRDGNGDKSDESDSDGGGGDDDGDLAPARL